MGHIVKQEEKQQRNALSGSLHTFNANWNWKTYLPRKKEKTKIEADSGEMGDVRQNADGILSSE